jgi:glycosyltransferase involved in cell wall biosynthesis
MRILIAGYWGWLQYEKALADALINLGHEVIPFSFKEFFQGIFGHFQSALPLPGPALWNLNYALLKKGRASNADVVFVWRGTHLLPRTLRLMKAMGALTVSYNNDDPFGPMMHGNTPWHHHFLWMWYKRCLKDFDLNFMYRSVNVQEAVSFNAKNVHVLKPYFIPEQHHPVVLSEMDKERFSCDVVFIGHYEPDGREGYIAALVNAGLHVRLFGGGYWTKAVLGGLSSYFGDVVPVIGEDYAKALCGAKLCLAFLSKINRDSYTRRCFEIPACGCLLLCERTDDLKKMFIEDEEAVFFSSKEELVEKTLWLLSNPINIQQITEAGRKRVWTDGHNVENRAKQFIELVSESIIRRG